MKDLVVQCSSVAKKYCYSLKHTMLYGGIDLLKSFFGMDTHPGRLRSGEFWAIRDATFELKRGENLGIIGPNGAGKSTLLKMLNGILMPDKGSIKVKGSTAALIDVGAGFHPLLTGRENIYINATILGLKKITIDERFDSIVEFSGVGKYVDLPVKHYSDGMIVRLGFSIIVHSSPDVLLVDEVLAVGDTGFQSKCFQMISQLKSNGMATVLVSHNMHAISTFAEKVILLNEGLATIYDDVSKGIEAYNNLFLGNSASGIEKITSGNDFIQFYNASFNKRTLNPGDSFEATLYYTSSKLYEDVTVDTVLLNSYDAEPYFQISNRSFDKRIDLIEGDHKLIIRIFHIPINGALSRLSIAIKTSDHIESLFWWRIPLEFKRIPCATGNNFLNISYEYS